MSAWCRIVIDGQVDDVPAGALDAQAEIGLLGVDEEALVEAARRSRAPPGAASMNDPEAQSHSDLAVVAGEVELPLAEP